MSQHDPEFYRKYIGLGQCSAEKPLHIRVEDDTVILSVGLAMKPVLILSHAEFLTWSSHKILNKAGVKINDNAS